MFCFRPYVKDKFLQEIEKECVSLCSLNTPSLLRQVKPSDLLSTDLQDIANEWKDRAELLYSVLCSICDTQKKNDFPVNAMVTAGSIMLKCRNKHMSRWHHCLALMLDFGGAKNKTISAMNACGLSVTPHTMNEKKKDMEVWHDSLVESTLINRKETLLAKALLDTLMLPLPIYSVNESTTDIIMWLLKVKASPCSPCSISNNILLEPSSTSYEIYGDNLDHTIHTYHRTKENKGKDIHWFLMLYAEQRVKSPPHLNHSRPRRDILSVSNDNFLPDTDAIQSLRQSFIFHVMETIVKYVPGLQKIAIPKYIPHPHLTEMSRKCPYDVLDLLDKSENKMEDMIDILNSIHKLVPTLPSDKQNVVERIVFGGDQLTNERAYAAQISMVNVQNEAERLQGVIHRPEGLHLCMNFCKYITEIFNSSSSAADPGTLYNLSVLVDRSRDMGLDMTTSYSASLNFVKDALAAHIVAAAFDILDINSLDQEPPVKITDMLTDCESVQREFVEDLAVKIVDEYVLDNLQNNQAAHMTEVVAQQQTFNTLDSNGRFVCPFSDCSKTYTSNGWLKSHLRKVHAVNVELSAPRVRPHNTSDYDGKVNYASAFMKAALLLRDTVDAYSMGDGDRVFRNLKFLFLHFDHGHHIKYKLWTWRMLAYDQALLSEAEAYTYHWNIAINLSGGIRHCIPNDQLVELNVHKMKEAMRCMGANVTYDATRRTSKCVHAISKLTDSLARPVSGKHTHASTACDVSSMVNCLIKHCIFKKQPGREHATYPSFPSDLLQNVDMVALCRWIDGWKKRTYGEMQLAST